MSETPWTDRLHYKYGLSIDFFHGVKEIEITLAAAQREIERLKRRLASEIKWGHRKCTPDNCTSSGEDCPAALAGAGEI